MILVIDINIADVLHSERDEVSRPSFELSIISST